MLQQRITDGVLARVDSYGAPSRSPDVRSLRRLKKVRPLPPRETELLVPPAVQS